LLAVYFRERIKKLIATFARGARRPDDIDASSEPGHRGICGDGDPGISAHQNDRQASGEFVHYGAALLIGGVVMWIGGRVEFGFGAAGLGPTGTRIHTWHMEDMSVLQAVWIGACQFCRQVPGTSRSMSTIAAGQLAGMSRASALEFRFSSRSPRWWWLLATIAKSLRGQGREAMGVTHIDPPAGCAGIGFVGVVHRGDGAVAWFLAWVRNARVCAVCGLRIIVGAAVCIGLRGWGIAG